MESGVVLVAPLVDPFHFNKTRFAIEVPPAVWMKATCEPSRDSTTEVTTDPPVL
jgi:hypothetical protein